jgi:hypothetical protein
MSAYAVPGYLFPPLPSSFDAIGQSNVSIVDRPSTYVEKIDAFSYHSRSSEQPFYSAEPTNGIQITVHDTKIDAVQLIQSFLSFSPSSTGSSAGRRKPPSRRRYGRSPAWNRSGAASSVDPTVSSTVAKPLHREEGCMMFTLRMVLGVKGDSPECDGADVYQSPLTITRTLAQIRQLYSDIVMEQEVVEDGVEPFHCHAHFSVPDIPLPPCNMTLHGGAQDYHNLPSFTYLQEQIRSYVPLLNHWFRQLVQKIPLMRSSVFMKFIDTKADAASVLVREAPIAQWSPDPWYDTPNDDMPAYVSLRPSVGGTPKGGRMARRIDSMESIDEGRGDEDDEID